MCWIKKSHLTGWLKNMLVLSDKVLRKIRLKEADKVYNI